MRCSWVGKGNTLMEQYHDQEWGVPVYDDKVHFEFLVLEGAQAGLSWDIVLKRRGEYAKAFLDFDWEKVARFTEKEVEKILSTTNIIRNRKKVESVITNAQAFKEVRREFGSFSNYIWQFVNHKPLQPQHKPGANIPCLSKESEALSKDLIKKGFKFVGPKIMYSHMQATGLINDHTTDCDCFQKLFHSQKSDKSST